MGSASSGIAGAAAAIGNVLGHGARTGDAGPSLGAQSEGSSPPIGSVTGYLNQTPALDQSSIVNYLGNVLNLNPSKPGDLSEIYNVISQQQGGQGVPSLLGSQTGNGPQTRGPISSQPSTKAPTIPTIGSQRGGGGGGGNSLDIGSLGALAGSLGLLATLGGSSSAGDILNQLSQGGLLPGLGGLQVLAGSNQILNPLQPIQLPNSQSPDDNSDQKKKKKKSPIQVLSDPNLNITLG